MFAVIYIPDFALQAALRLEPELHRKPLALIDVNIPKTPIVQLTQSARGFGVTEGLTPTQARARCGQIIIKSRSAAMEKAATDALLQCAYDFSPDIEATADGVVTLDLKGFANLDLQNYAQKMVEQVRLLDLNAQVGVAGNPLLALYAARQAKPVLVVLERSGVRSASFQTCRITDFQSAGRESNPTPAGLETRDTAGLEVCATDFLHALPIEAIEPSAETLRVLKQWGVRTLGSFVTLGEDALCERLGIEGRILFDRANARSSRPLRLVRPEQRFEEAIEFEHEIETAEPLLFVLRRFVEQIVVRMNMTGKVAETLALRLKFSAGPDYEHVFKVPEPTSNDEVLFRMIHTHLENFKSEHAIIGLHLSGKPCLGRVRQFGLFESSLRDPNHFSETLARLSALLGADRLGTPAVKPTHRPDAFEMKPVDFERRAGFAFPKTTLEISQSESNFGIPLRRFRPSLPAEVELADGCPIRFHTPAFSGVIRAARGPWRSSGDWWDNQSWARDEWDVETTDGSLFRLFVQNDRWFVEGIYD